MFEVVIGNSLAKQVSTRIKADEFVTKAKTLFGTDIKWDINEVKLLYDSEGQQRGTLVTRVAGSTDVEAA